jgi:hypothetical protein
MMRDLRTGEDNLSNRAADGGIQQPGPLLGDAVHAPNSNIIAFPSAFLPDSRAKSREPSIDLRELATGFFIGCVFTLAAVLIFVGYFGYRALIA